MISYWPDVFAMVKNSSSSSSGENANTWALGIAVTPSAWKTVPNIDDPAPSDMFMPAES